MAIVTEENKSAPGAKLTKEDGVFVIRPQGVLRSERDRKAIEDLVLDTQKESRVPLLVDISDTEVDFVRSGFPLLRKAINQRGDTYLKISPEQKDLLESTATADLFKLADSAHDARGKAQTAKAQSARR